MDPVKDAFFKIKSDISLLREAIFELKAELDDLKSQISFQNQQNQEISPKNLFPADDSENPTHYQHTTPLPTHNPTLPQEIGGFGSQYIPVSIGNGGVQTDNPTNKPTHQQTDISEENLTPNRFQVLNNSQFIPTSNPQFKPLSRDFERASQLLSSLDSLKREIRLKFKQITQQEMAVFSTIYSLEESYKLSSPFEDPEISYKTLANTLNLTESSIRDYVNKLIQKGIPILKVKKNNKKVYLSISPELKKIASLSTINRLREI